VWSGLRAIDVTIRVRVPHDHGVQDTTWSAEVLPRNVLSH
jgi:hypothetical protein